jgi:hypothetical protein
MRKECPQIFKEEKKIGEALQKSRNQVEPQDSGNSVVQYLRNPSCTGSGYVQLPTVMKHSTTTKCINSNNINTLISMHIRSTVQCQKQIGT